MPIKALYATQDEIPESYRDLYEERGGQYHLTQIEGFKTDADVARIQRSLDKERLDHGKIKETVSSFLGERTWDEVHSDLDRLPELEAAAEGKIDQSKMDELVESRLKTKLSPLERQLQTTTKERDDALAENATFKAKDIQRQIHDTVRAAASKAKVVDTAMDDVLMLAERMFEINEDGTITAKDGAGVTPGIAPEVWLTEMQSKRPHWWPASQGGGGRGGSGGGGFANNPWSADHWNMTEQSRLYRELGAEKAGQMAQAAGTTLGGLKPTPKK